MGANRTLCFLLLASLCGAFMSACNKSNNAAPGPQDNRTGLPGNWAAAVLVNSTNGHSDTTYFSTRADSLQFTTAGKLNAAYYVQSFDTTTDQVVWLRTIDSAGYTFVDDTTIHVTGHTSLYIPNNSGDLFRIRYLDGAQLELYAPDQSGVGGLLYVYTRF